MTELTADGVATDANALCDGTRRRGLTGEQLSQYWQHGFVVVRGLFAEQIHLLRDETERLLSERQDLINPRNVRCRFMPHFATGESLFEVFDPVLDVSPVCDQFARHSDILEIMQAIYEEPACVFKEKLIFKPAGATGYKLHQDIPRYWEGFPSSFVTVLMVIDQTTQQNGCTEVFSGYHHSFISDSPEVYMLPDDCVDSARRTWLELEPGDVAIFHGLTPHRSEPNKSSTMRRSFYVSYNKQSDGGDQRLQHYAQFQQKMLKRLEDTGVSAYFQ